MYFTHNEVKSVFAERSNYSKFYLEYLYKLIYEYISTYHLSISKRAIDPDYSALNEKLGRILKHLNLDLVTETG